MERPDFHRRQVGTAEPRRCQSLLLFLWKPTPSITVSIRATSGGVPTGGDLATASTVITNWSVGAQAWFTAKFRDAGDGQFRHAVHWWFGRRRRTPTAPWPSATARFRLRPAMTSTVAASCSSAPIAVHPDRPDVWHVRDIRRRLQDLCRQRQHRLQQCRGSYLLGQDGGTSPTWTTVSWTDSTPTSTALKFQAAASSSSGGLFNFVGPDGTTGTYYTSGASLDRFSGSRYLKYRAFLSTTNSSSTPTLSDATVCYTAPASADLSITNSDGATTAVPGGTVTYSISSRERGTECRQRRDGHGHVPGHAVVPATGPVSGRRQRAPARPPVRAASAIRPSICRSVQASPIRRHVRSRRPRPAR